MRNEQIVENLIQYISKNLFYTRDMDYKAFIDDSMVLEACVFNFSQMGELVKRWTKILKRHIIPFHGGNYMVCEMN